MPVSDPLRVPAGSALVAWVRWFRLGALLLVAWVAMTFTHEAGHLIGGWLGGAVLTSYELRPWRLPYSIHTPDPRPLVTLWAGPCIGVLVPLLVAAALRHRWGWFVAGFCLLANGCYLAMAWYSGDPHLDTTRLLGHGASKLSVVAYIVITVGVGYPLFRNACRRELSGGMDTSLENEQATPSS